MQHVDTPFIILVNPLPGSGDWVRVTSMPLSEFSEMLNNGMLNGILGEISNGNAERVNTTASPAAPRVIGVRRPRVIPFPKGRAVRELVSNHH